MGKHKANTAVSVESTFVVDLSQLSAAALSCWPNKQNAFQDRFLLGPLHLCSSSLGFGDELILVVMDSSRVHVTVNSVQVLLQVIEHFNERDRTSLLVAAAHYYGLDPYALMGRPA